MTVGTMTVIMLTSEEYMNNSQCTITQCTVQGAQSVHNYTVHN